MPLSLHIASCGMVLTLLPGRHVHQLVVATNILGAPTMLQRHTLVVMSSLYATYFY